MLWAPWSMSSKQMARSRSREMGRPKSWWLMASFWQKTHPREQPEKNTVPYTFVFVETAGKSEAVSGRTSRAKAGESLWDYAYFTGVSIDRLAENNRHIACIAALKDGEEVHVP